MKITSNLLEFLLLVVQILLMAVPCLYIICWQPDVVMITPGMVIPWLLMLYLVMIAVCRWTSVPISLFTLVNALIPWVVYHWSLFPLERYEGRLWAQLLFYCTAQAVWIWATNPVWNGKMIEWIRGYKAKKM
ncbi:MAG: hypothetical protein RR270_07505 [Alistipes sp.]